MTAFQLACEEAGHANCAFLVRSESRSEVIDDVRNHLSAAHHEEPNRETIRTAVSEVDWEPR